MRITIVYVVFTAISLGFPGITLGQLPDSAGFYFQLGVEAKTAGRLKEAHQQFSKAISFHPGFVEAHLESGYLCLQMHRPAEAIREFSAVTTLDSTNQIAWQHLSELYYNSHDYTKARQAALQWKGGSPSVRLRALSSYHAGDLHTAARELSDYITSHPTDTLACLTLYRCYHDLENYKAAAAYYRQAVLLDGRNTRWMQDLATLYYNLHDYANAALFFQQAAAGGYPRDQEFDEALGYSLILSGKTTEGEALLEQVVERTGADRQVIRNIAHAFYDHQLYDRSLAWCEKLLRTDLRDGKALYLAGMCFRKKGDTQKAEGYFNKAIDIDPSLSSLRR